MFLTVWEGLDARFHTSPLPVRCSARRSPRNAMHARARNRTNAARPGTPCAVHAAPNLLFLTSSVPRVGLHHSVCPFEFPGRFRSLGLPACMRHAWQTNPFPSTLLLRRVSSLTWLQEHHVRCVPPFVGTHTRAGFAGFRQLPHAGGRVLRAAATSGRLLSACGNGFNVRILICMHPGACWRCPTRPFVVLQAFSAGLAPFR